jgi:hypothetical protein
VAIERLRLSRVAATPPKSIKRTILEGRIVTQ